MASGSGVVSGFVGETVRTARAVVDRTYLEDLMSKQMSVYCPESQDRMPNDNATQSYYTLREVPGNEIGDFFDPAWDVDAFPDFTRLRVWASDTQVTMELSFRLLKSDLFASIYMDEDNGNRDELLLTFDTGSFQRRRNLGETNDTESDSVYVTFPDESEEVEDEVPSPAPSATLIPTTSPTSGRVETMPPVSSPIEAPFPTPYPRAETSLPTAVPTTPRIEPTLPAPTDEIVQISFHRSRVPDLMNRKIWVHSIRSNDRMPDEGEAPSYFTLSAR